MIKFLGLYEPFSSISHLGAAVVFSIYSFFLYRRGKGKGGPVFVLIIFSFTCVYLLSMSGVYHLLSKGEPASEVIRRLDHAGIFLLIAGTFTAVHGYLFKGFWRWGMMSLIWLLAITGITLKTIFFNHVSEGLSLTFYIGLGWFGAVSGYLLWRKFGLTFIVPLLLGAAAYTMGALLEFFRVPNIMPGIIGPHEIFHIFVIAGIAFHWKFVHQFADNHLSIKN